MAAASFFSFLALLVAVVPDPVRAHSETPSSNRRGVCVWERAMLDLGESRVVLVTER